MTTLHEALDLYLARQDRRSHPDGTFDKKYRWYPSTTEKQACCLGVRSPSAAYPYSLMLHCRSVEHVAALTGVETSDLRKAVRQARPTLKPYSRTDRRFKAVAVVDGRYYSIYDGKTEYVIGKAQIQKARPEHRGGYYVYATAEAATDADVPSGSELEHAPRVILEVEAAGTCVEYACNCYDCDLRFVGSSQRAHPTKYAYTKIRPVGVVSPAETRQEVA